ncbi:hypothetical protein MUK42_07460 [Musa troglodytarum]|uniref:Uncharacterized protein n=1 Tax=Musa troglodytarum TaxID=320322 RepID=A0A9E7HSB9_9LILI|nr:hypothetical protein MUK42_07460 [Musa troglodytarum]
MLADRIRRKLTDLVGKEEKTLDDLMRITHTSAWTNRNAANLPKTPLSSEEEEEAPSMASSIVAAEKNDREDGGTIATRLDKVARHGQT